MATPPRDPDQPVSGVGRSAGVPTGVAGELVGMRARVREACETLWAARAPGELMDVVAEVEALKSTLDALELAVVAELDNPRRHRRRMGLDA